MVIEDMGDNDSNDDGRKNRLMQLEMSNIENINRSKASPLGNDNGFK